MSEYNIERISSERLKDLLPLYADAFGKNVSLAYFQKKFDTKIFGAEFIGYLAYEAKGSPAAYYGLFPCRVELDGKNILSATSGDTMTHSAHRGKGLFVELAQKTYSLARESGIRFAFGFPNQNSWKGSVNLGWQYREEYLRFYSIKLNTLPIAKLKKKLGIGEKSNGDGAISNFPNSLFGTVVGSVVHDADYFKYKMYSSKRIEVIAGSRVWMKADGVLKIGDVERIAGFNGTQFLSELKNYVRKKGFSEIQFMVSNDTWLDKELAASLEGMNAFRVGHFDLNAAGLDLTKMKYTMADLDTF